VRLLWQKAELLDTYVPRWLHTRSTHPPLPSRSPPPQVLALVSHAQEERRRKRTAAPRKIE